MSIFQSDTIVAEFFKFKLFNTTNPEQNTSSQNYKNISLNGGSRFKIINNKLIAIGTPIYTFVGHTLTDTQSNQSINLPEDIISVSANPEYAPSTIACLSASSLYLASFATKTFIKCKPANVTSSIFY
jgi:hypothetical protein